MDNREFPAVIPASHIRTRDHPDFQLKENTFRNAILCFETDNAIGAKLHLDKFNYKHLPRCLWTDPVTPCEPRKHSKQHIPLTTRIPLEEWGNGAEVWVFPAILRRANATIVCMTPRSNQLRESDGNTFRPLCTNGKNILYVFSRTLSREANPPIPPQVVDEDMLKIHLESADGLFHFQGRISWGADRYVPLYAGLMVDHLLGNLWVCRTRWTGAIMPELEESGDGIIGSITPRRHNAGYLQKPASHVRVKNKRLRLSCPRDCIQGDTQKLESPTSPPPEHSAIMEPLRTEHTSPRARKSQFFPGNCKTREEIPPLEPENWVFAQMADQEVNTIQVGTPPPAPRLSQAGVARFAEDIQRSLPQNNAQIDADAIYAAEVQARLDCNSAPVVKVQHPLFDSLQRLYRKPNPPSPFLQKLYISDEDRELLKGKLWHVDFQLDPTANERCQHSSDEKRSWHSEDTDIDGECDNEEDLAGQLLTFRDHEKQQALEDSWAEVKRLSRERKMAAENGHGMSTSHCQPASLEVGMAHPSRSGELAKAQDNLRRERCAAMAASNGTLTESQAKWQQRVSLEQALYRAVERLKAQQAQTEDSKALKFCNDMEVEIMPAAPGLVDVATSKAKDEVPVPVGFGASPDRFSSRKSNPADAVSIGNANTVATSTTDAHTLSIADTISPSIVAMDTPSTVALDTLSRSHESEDGQSPLEQSEEGQSGSESSDDDHDMEDACVRLDL